MTASEIDNIAYGLYLKYINEMLINKNIEHIKIEEFINYKKIFISFYKDANIFLRKEKINNINEKLL